MSSKQTTLAAVGVSDPIRVNLYTFISGVSVVVHVPAGTTVNYDVEVSPDSQEIGVPTRWLPHGTLVGKTVSAGDNIVFPINWARLKINSISGGGALTLSVVQIN